MDNIFSMCLLAKGYWISAVCTTPEKHYHQLSSSNCFIFCQKKLIRITDMLFLFNKTIIPLAFVRYEIIMAGHLISNACLWNNC